MKSIWSMIEHLHGIIDELTTWQADFVRTCYNTVQHNHDTSRLSGKQVEIISEIFDKYYS